MKKLILGIIAVFLVEIAFISYSKWGSPDEPEVAAVEIPSSPAGSGFRYGRQVQGVAAWAGSGLELPEAAVFRPRRVEAGEGRLPRRRSGQDVPHSLRVRDALTYGLTVRKPRREAAPQPGYRTEVERQYFGSNVVEVSYRVYEFRPRNSKARKAALVA